MTDVSKHSKKSPPKSDSDSGTTIVAVTFWGGLLRVTFHDSLKSIEKLRTALPLALDWLIREGYEFKVFE